MSAAKLNRKSASYEWQRRRRFQNPKNFCNRRHDISDPLNREWDGTFWQCRICMKGGYVTPNETVPLTDQILALQERIEREPLAYRKAELREQMRLLVRQGRGM